MSTGKRIASFNYSGDLYEVYDDDPPTLYKYGKGGKYMGQMWWLNKNSGVGRFRAVAKDFEAAEGKAIAKRDAAKNRPTVVHHTYHRPGWRGHVALRGQVQKLLSVKEHSTWKGASK